MSVINCVKRCVCLIDFINIIIFINDQHDWIKTLNSSHSMLTPQHANQCS